MECVPETIFSPAYHHPKERCGAVTDKGNTDTVYSSDIFNTKVIFSIEWMSLLFANHNLFQFPWICIHL